LSSDYEESDYLLRGEDGCFLDVLDYLLKPSVVKLIIFYLPPKPGRPIGGKVLPDVGEVSFSIFLRDKSKGVILLLLKDMPPRTLPEDFIGIKLIKFVLPELDILAFLLLVSGEFIVF